MKYGDTMELFGVGPADRPKARRTDPVTSKAAAEEMTDLRVSELQAAVLRALARLGGQGTADDITDESGVDYRSVTPRLRPLALKGMVAEVGRQRSERTNRLQIVWGLTAHGDRVLAGPGE